MSKQSAAVALDQAPVNPQLVIDRAIYLVVKRGRLGVTRKAKAVHVDGNTAVKPSEMGGAVATDADLTVLRVSKRILNCDTLNKIARLDNDLRVYLSTHCLPSMFRRGIWLLPLTLHAEVEARLTAVQQEREALVAAFLEEYDAECDAAADKLRSLYDPTEYPPKARVAAAFYFDWQLMSIDVPGSLRHLSKDLYQRESAKMTEHLRLAAEDIQTGLCTAFAELVQGMRDALMADEGGKRKRFHGSRIEKLREYITLFRNITDYGQLETLVTTAQSLLDGVDADMIRDSEELRDVLHEEFAKLSGDLDVLVTAAPRRLIDLGEEE